MSTAERSARAPQALGQRGVTLIETLVALALFAISMAGIGSFLVQQIRMSSRNYITSVAYSLAEQEMEALRALEYEEIAGRSSSQENGGTTFTLSTEVQNETPAENMKQITVNVSWPAFEGTQNVSLQTIYTRIKR
jgi:prepilin-type N-terminal cleavage/methylation domain-containing protein